VFERVRKGIRKRVRKSVRKGVCSKGCSKDCSKECPKEFERVPGWRRESSKEFGRAIETVFVRVLEMVF